MLLALAAMLGWKIFHLDVKSAFLNGFLQEEIFIEQPEGFLARGLEDKVCRLKKALYGLKQAPRAWYSRIDAYLLKQGFSRSEAEATLYLKKFDGKVHLIISLYVDDLLITGGDETAMNHFKLDMMKEFEMSDLGLMHYFLGFEIHQQAGGIFLSQMKYAIDVLKRFRMNESKQVQTPLAVNMKLSKDDESDAADSTLFRSIIRSLLYLSASRPDIMFVASYLSRFMQSPSQLHFCAAKRVLRYVKATIDFGIEFKKIDSIRLLGYCDSDWAGSVDDSKSTSGYVFSFGSGVFAWNSKKQEVVVQSSAEAEYVSAAAASNQAIWLRKLLGDLGYKEEFPTTIYVDNKSAIAIAQNPVQHCRTKHISVKFHAIREAVKNGEIQLMHCSSDEQIADVLTKSLSKDKFEYLRKKLGVCPKKP